MNNPKKNNKKTGTPQEAPRCTFEDFTNACANYNSRNNFTEEYKLPKKHNDNEFVDENPFLVFYEDYGYSQSQIAEALGISLAQCREINGDFNKITAPILTKFCTLFDLHPVEMQPYNVPSPPVILNALISSYKAARNENSKDFERMEDIKIALLSQCDPEYSVDMIRESLEISDEIFSPKLKAAVDLLNVLSVNDGNPLLGGYGADEIADIFEMRIADKIEKTDRRLNATREHIDRIDAELDDIGYECFGYAWEDHKKLLNEAIHENGEDFAKSFFMDDFEPASGISPVTKLSLWGQFQIRTYIAQEQDDTQNKLQELVEVLELFRDFREDFFETFQYYNNRQAILALGDKDFGPAMGDVNSPYYLQVSLKDQERTARITSSDALRPR